MLEHLGRQSATDRLELVLVDRGVTAAAARTLGRDYDVEVRRVGWDDERPPAADRNRQVRRPWRLGRCRASVMRALDVS
jgi:putative transposase